jgi:hypothetical protein
MRDSVANLNQVQPELLGQFILSILSQKLVRAWLSQQKLAIKNEISWKTFRNEVEEVKEGDVRYTKSNLKWGNN